MSRLEPEYGPLLSIAKIGDSSHACDGGSSSMLTGSADDADVGAASALLALWGRRRRVGATITMSMIHYPRILRHETVLH